MIDASEHFGPPETPWTPDAELGPEDGGEIPRLLFPLCGGKPMHYILDANGNPVPCQDALKFWAWQARSWATGEGRIGLTQVGGHMVSTVFLGTDHGLTWRKHDDPVLWETMTFTLSGWERGESTGEQHRYTSRASALLGHEETVFRLRQEEEARCRKAQMDEQK